MNELMRIYKSVLKPGEKLCLLGDATNATPMSKEVRDYLTEEMPKYIKAHAIISPHALDTTLNSTF